MFEISFSSYGQEIWPEQCELGFLAPLPETWHFEIKRKLKMYAPDDAQCASHVYYTPHTCKFLVKSWCFYVLPVLESEPEKKDFHEKFRENDFTKIWQWNFTTLLFCTPLTHILACVIFFSKQNLSKRKNACSTKKGQRKLVIFPFLKFICYVRIFCNRIRLQ